MIDTIAPPAIERPPQTTPTVLRLDQSSPLPRLDDARDYIIILPSVVRIRNIATRGGRNLVFVGGRVSIDKGLDEACWSLKDGAPGRVIHIEGITNDARRGGMSDGYQIGCPHSHVQIVNGRTTGLIGGFEREKGYRHADVMQNLGCLSLAIERFTGSSHYNNLYMRRENDPLGFTMGDVRIAFANLYGYKTNPLATSTQQTLRAISLGTQPEPAPGDPTDPENCDLTGSVWLHEVYGDAASAGRTLGDFVWPHAGSRMVQLCRATVAADGRSVDWSHWRADSPTPGMVYGAVQAGPPPGGDFQPAATCGLNYPGRMR